ncbi:MAG TPA: diacylglycerol kinase family protein [Acidimicrobiia bacterium]|nr:diacylglycerol kinase family protein [Acidimicrobiia bacterium]
MKKNLRLTLIANPFASSFSARRVRVIERALNSVGKLEIVKTQERGHATEIAKKAAEDEVDVVVVLAGDGTLNEAAQGVMHSQTALAPLPGGSTNVFARAIGYSNDAIEALGELILAIEDSSFSTIGVGSLNDRVFLANAGCGLDAEVIARVERNAKIKKVAPHPFTLSTAIQTYIKDFDRKKQQMSVKLDGDLDGVRMLGSDPTVFSEANMVVISNVSPWTYLGTREVILAPTAKLENALTITAIRELTPYKLARISMSALGRHKTVMHDKDIAHCDDVHSAIIEALHVAIPYQVDGDYLGSTMQAEISYLPNSLKIVVPLVE